jgi:hypothetical protein
MSAPEATPVGFGWVQVSAEVVSGAVALALATPCGRTATRTQPRDRTEAATARLQRILTFFFFPFEISLLWDRSVLRS